MRLLYYVMNSLRLCKIIVFKTCSKVSTKFGGQDCLECKSFILLFNLFLIVCGISFAISTVYKKVCNNNVLIEVLERENEKII